MERVYEELSRASGWMKTMGILYIVSGIISAITIVGIIYAWLPIWMGVIVYQAGKSAQMASTNKDETKLMEVVSKIRLFFVISVIVGIVAYAIVIIVGIIYLFGLFSMMKGVYGD
jgi:low temperature requirement protein LtrA